jgi:copper chaperone CopZ
VAKNNSWLTLKIIKMKKILSILIFTLGFITFGFAQQKANDKAIIQTPGVHCEYCKKRLENYVSSQPGILTVVADFKKKTTTVSWVKDRTNIEEVKAHIANAGYDADDVTAEETAYKKLPMCCKKPAQPSKETKE